MSNSVVYERDLLYPTENISEPGSIHVEVLSPNSKGKMPIIIEAKTNHCPVDYINSIIGIMQSDIFDRIHINIKLNAELYIQATEELKKKHGESKLIKVVFEGESISYLPVNEIE